MDDERFEKDFMAYVDSLKLLSGEWRYIYAIMDDLKRIHKDFSFDELIRQAQRSFHRVRPNAIEDPYHVEKIVSYKVVYDV